MNNVLLWFGGFLVVVLCALFGVPHFVDWTRYRGVFEEEASRVLGRELRVAGAVNLRLLPTPYVRFEKVRLSDAVGQTGEPFFRADDFTLWLAPGPLLRGAIEAREIELRRPTLKLRLNAQGGGNWQTLSIARGALPFVPSDVALQSVRITEGTVSVDGADGQELARLAAVTGELAMNALEGPYRFKGTVDWHGGRYETRVSTAAFDADGGLRLKTQISVPAASNGITLEGRLADLSGKVHLDGQLSGQLAFDPTALSRGATTAPGTSKTLPVELRSNLTVDAAGAKFTDASLAFELDGKPQLVAGSADVGWREGLSVNSEFSARWIDIDQLLADKAVGGKPLDVLRRLGTAVGRLVPQSGQGKATVVVDQVTLGGEPLSDVRVQVERSDTVLRLADFRVNAPGGTRVALSGALPGGEAFDGDVNLRGANLARLLSWLGLSAAVGEARTEGAFSLKSKLAFDPSAVTVRDAFASLGGAVLTGGIGYRWAGRPRLDVVLEGDQIDLSLLSPKALDLLSHTRQLTGSERDVSAAATKATSPQLARPAFDPRQQDLTLRIRAGRLVDADRDLRDVDIDAAVLNGVLGLKRMRLASGAGLELEAEGEIAEIAVRPRGILRGTVGIGDEAAIAELLELFDHNANGPVAKHLRPLVPARMAWTTRFGGEAKDKDAAADRSAAPAEAWFDGAVLGRRLTANIRLDGGAGAWAQSNLTLNATIERPDWQRLRALISADTGTTSARPGLNAAPSRSRLQVKASGRPDQALNTYIKLEDDAFDAGATGRVAIANGAIGSAEGELQLRTSDAAQALAALGIKARNMPGVALEGAAEIAFKGDQLKITPSALEVAGAVVGGEVTVARVKGAERHRLDGRLTASHANIPRLVDLLVDPAGGGVREAGQVWQSAAFDFALLDQFEGRLKLEAAELALTPEVGLARATVETDFGPGRIELRALEGDVLGSRLTSKWRLDKAPAGANLTGSATLAGAKLDQLAPARGQIAGTAALSAEISGRGLAPRSLLSALTGKGEITIGKGGVVVLTPAQLRSLSDEVVTGKREPTIEVLEKAVLAALSGTAAPGRLDLGDRKIGFTVGDSAVKVQPFAVESAEGRASNRTTLDLAALMLDSEWKIEQSNPKSAAPGKVQGPLPPVTIVFVGPVAALGRLDPVISVDSLVRELAVRRMERDVEELERLRRLDEERAKAEAERRRTEEAARAAAAAAAAAVAPFVPGAAVPLADGAPPPAASMATEPPSSPSAAIIPAPAAGDVAPPPAASEPRRRQQSGSASEPRQVPSSQSFKNSRAYDVFRKQESGGR